MEIELLKKENTPENVIEHSIAVRKKAMKIASNFDNADKDLIRKGALLHDIGRSKTHDITHAIEGVRIAEKYGYGRDVLNIIERHIGAGITEKEAEKQGLCYQYSTETDEVYFDMTTFQLPDVEECDLPFQ